MKRIGRLFENVHEFGALTTAAWRASRGKLDRGPVRRFLLQLDEHLAQLADDLRSGRFRFDDYTSFEIRDPKSRTIRAPAFRDRIVHHALVAATGPTFELGAIDHSYACRKGLGHHAAVRRASRWLSGAPWFLKLDVAKIYDSVAHEPLRRSLDRRFAERRLLRLFDVLLDSYETRPGRGLPIGALTSQYLGNFVLDPIDHGIVRRNRACRYLRYMDDVLVLGERHTLLAIRSQFARRLAAIGLEPKGDGILNRTSLGVPWLGFTLYRDRVRLNAAGRKRLRRRWRDLERRHLRGHLGEHELAVRTMALFAHARSADDVGWRRAILSFGRTREALELHEPRHARRQLVEFRQELPLGLPQQEAPEEPQRRPRLSCLSAPRDEGEQSPTDVALSCAPQCARCGDETPGRAPVMPEIRRAGGSSEKAVSGDPPTSEWREP